MTGSETSDAHQQPDAAAQDPFKVLLVDDDPVNLQVLAGLLNHRDDLRLLQATDGVEAVRIAESEQCDLVLMDVLMPNMDGHEATRRIKSQDQGRYVPVLFVTALHENEEMARCVESGGDDFITKPVNRVQLNTRVDAWLRVSRVYRTLSEQRDALDAYQRRNEVDQWIAREVTQRATRSEVLNLSGVQAVYRPAEILSGDILLAEQAPDGRCFFLLGDFTGHGIAASIGTLPTADLFRDQVARGSTSAQVLRAINHKLCEQLPTNLFLAACLLVYDPEDDALEAWNGGMPPVVYRDHDGDTGRIVSTHVPLGIKKEMGAGEVISLPAPEWVWAVSDGVMEARDATGAEFGRSRVETALVARGIESVEQSVDRFREAATDDITMLQIHTSVLRGGLAERTAPQGLPDWCLTLHLDAAALRMLAPLQPIATAVAEMEGVDSAARQLFMTVINEMFANSLEHGVLNLDSRLKENADGFAAYYEQRERALADLDDGYVRIELDRFRDARGSFLVIRMNDSGYGFDHERMIGQVNDPSPSPDAFSGRGIPLLLNTCESVTYRGRGNRVEARLRLSH